jgi:hypothetical protein
MHYCVGRQIDRQTDTCGGQMVEHLPGLRFIRNLQKYEAEIFSSNERELEDVPR